MVEPARPGTARTACAVGDRWLCEWLRLIARALADLPQADRDALADIATAYVDRPGPELIEAARHHAAQRVEAWRQQLTPHPPEDQ